MIHPETSQRRRMPPKERDELALMAIAFVEQCSLERREAKKVVASMFNLTEDMAWALIVRGRTLAKQKGRAA